MTRAVDLTITGRVQGVSFRYYATREAAHLEVAGWVRNQPDGSVALHAEGPDAAVDALVRWCGSGPPGARVERVEVTEGDVTGAAGFDVRS